jgi:hypothetical protein
MVKEDSKHKGREYRGEGRQAKNREDGLKRRDSAICNEIWIPRKEQLSEPPINS